MTPQHLCILLLAVVATGTVAGQSEDIPIENDNQFPPEKDLETDGTIIEGSGTGTLEEPITEFESTPAPPLEEIQNRQLSENVPTTTSDPEQSCPSPCVCNTEGASDNFIVDCSGYDLKEFPSPLDPRTTTLNIQKNKLTEIPKEVASLKNLKVLNADSNSITDLSAGSISELAELTVLKLSNNRLIEFPQDLKNSFGLTKLEELDLGGNDMRTSLTPESFSNFKSLRKLTLPTSTTEFVQDLCTTLSASLETVCTEKCSTQSYDCPDAPQKNEDELLEATLAGTIALDIADDNNDPIINNPNDAESDTEDTPRKDEAVMTSSTTNEKSGAANEVPMTRSNVNNAPEEVAHAKFNSIVDIPKDAADESDNDHIQKEVKVGATTVDSNSGGVSKSVIGFIVAGMVLVVAGITIKKNWSSIRKRFSSSPRTPTERPGTNTNGTAPEEVPLQDKSPV